MLRVNRSNRVSTGLISHVPNHVFPCDACEASLLKDPKKRLTNRFCCKTRKKKLHSKLIQWPKMKFLLSCC